MEHDIVKIREHYSEEQNIQQRIELATKGFTGKLTTHNFQKCANLLTPYMEGEKIADIGCGFGYLMHFLPHNVEVYGIDLSPQALHMAREFRKDFLPVQADVHSMPCLAEGTFDKLFCINLTPHLLDVSKALEECFRILKPNGLAIINFLNKFGLANIHFLIFKIRAGYYFRHSIMTPSPQNSFAYYEAKKILEKVGFETLDTYGWGITVPHLLGQKIPRVAYKVTDYMIKIQDFALIKVLSNAIVFKVRKKEE